MPARAHPPTVERRDWPRDVQMLSEQFARGALRDLDDVRARFGHRLTTPWWYKVVAALIVAALFAGTGMPYDSLLLGSSVIGAFLVVFAAVAGPVLLRALLKRSTGASFTYLHEEWTDRRLSRGEFPSGSRASA
ncbi:hypothetical protein [Nocardioides pacificus]